MAVCCSAHPRFCCFSFVTFFARPPSTALCNPRNLRLQKAVSSHKKQKNRYTPTTSTVSLAPKVKTTPSYLT
jgi:hypothetical protein